MADRKSLTTAGWTRNVADHGGTAAQRMDDVVVEWR